MDRKTSSKLTGLISKLTEAANKSVKKRNKDNSFKKAPTSHEYKMQLNLNHLEQNLRTT